MPDVRLLQPDNRLSKQTGNINTNKFRFKFKQWCKQVELLREEKRTLEKTHVLETFQERNERKWKENNDKFYFFPNVGEREGNKLK